MTDLRRPRWLALLPFVIASAGCRAQETAHEQRVVTAVNHGRYAEALAEARRLAEERPGDAQVRALALDAEVAYILDQGRREVFHGDLTRALALFQQAEALAPDHVAVRSWIKKTRAQLAVHWLDVAAECTGPERLGEAEGAYEKVLEHEPGNEAAMDGLARVLLLQNYRAGMSKTYFDDGLSSFRRLLLEQARREFSISRRYAENEPASLRGEQVEKMMAEERLTQAKELEASKKFFAARNEYRLVLLIDPANAEARAGLDRMDRETRATRSLAEVDMAIRRGELTQAEETLEEAVVLTEAQADDLSLLRSGIEERRLKDLYLAARNLSDDYRYPEAVAAFERLLAVAPDYEDAARRKATLEEFIQLAEEFYAKALSAPDDDVAEGYLRAIHPVIWPEYKDVVERLEAIESRRKEAESAEDEAGAQDEGEGSEDGAEEAPVERPGG
jgi:hypothetical protein